MNVGIDASKVVITKLKLDKDRKVCLSFFSSTPTRRASSHLAFNIQSNRRGEGVYRLSRGDTV